MLRVLLAQHLAYLVAYVFISLTFCNLRHGIDYVTKEICISFFPCFIYKHATRKFNGFWLRAGFTSYFCFRPTSDFRALVILVYCVRL